MITYKKVLKRYCPTREHNVEIEISRHKDGRITEMQSVRESSFI